MTGNTIGAAGFCGKLPIRADFVTRRVPLAYVERWHSWLAEMLAATRDALGEAWLDAYLYGPIWRFALPASVIGPSALVGTLMPSVDSVGRYFPFTIALPLPSFAALTSAVISGSEWFDGVEALSLAILDGDIEIDSLSERLSALELPAIAPGRQDRARDRAFPSPGLVITRRLEERAEDARLAKYAAAQLSTNNSLWWTSGCERIAPTMLFASGLPARDAFPAMLSGEWTKYGWETEAADFGISVTDAMIRGGSCE